ncbi:MAG: 6-phospho-3-hexuloisomerase [Hyphomicrobium sp.]
MTTPYTEALGELGAVMERLDDAAVDRACALIAVADKIVLHGLGREGLQMRGLCMRLFHLGLRVAMVGDMTAPALGPGDLFFVSSGPGALATAGELMKIARGAGAKVLLVTAQPAAALAPLADAVLVIPAQTMADDRRADASAVLPMGSVFEGAMFVVFEVMILKLKALLGVTPEQMRANHTNME